MALSMDTIVLEIVCLILTVLVFAEDLLLEIVTTCVVAMRSLIATAIAMAMQWLMIAEYVAEKMLHLMIVEYVLVIVYHAQIVQALRMER